MDADKRFKYTHENKHKKKKRKKKRETNTRLVKILPFKMIEMSIHDY